MISIMFHSAGLNILGWRSAHISDPLDIMREKLEVVHEEGYTTTTMEEASRNIGKRRDNLVHLSFDDGYLDNWVHVFPILREFGQKATIFMAADFADPRDVVREQRNIADRDHDPIGCCAGFLSYREMREMERSGLVEIQSHALTHTWYFKGPRIVDFWHPGAATEPMGPVWMLWNAFPERKPFYLAEAERLEREIPYGTPIYEHGKSLETVRYFPGEDELERRLADRVSSGPADFFRRTEWRSELNGVVGEYRERSGAKGRYETKDEYCARVGHELTESKRLLEEGLGHEIHGLCLPGGGVTGEVLAAAREAGYRHFTLPSKLRGSAGGDLTAGMIPRISSLPLVSLRRKNLGYPSKPDFRNHLRMNNGHPSARLLFILGKVRKLLSAG